MDNSRLDLRSCCATVLVAAALLPSVLVAQGAGRVLHPRLSPANPDLVAYETITADRQELMIQRLSNGEKFSASKRPTTGPISVLELPDLGAARNLSAYSGDADWYPRLIDGRQFFVYVSFEQGARRLFVNSLERNGSLSVTAPMAVPFPSGARHPRWSADGRHLAFSSDSAELHIIWNIDRALRSNSLAGVRVSRVSESGKGALFPAWSPRSSQIAYQVRRSVRGTMRLRVEALNLDTVAAAVRGAPVTLTEELTDADAIRPSWSRDGKYVAFYVDRAGSADGPSSALDIGVLEVQYQLSTGLMLGGTVLSGLSRRVADGVVPSDSRGPAWTQQLIDRVPTPAIVYVQRDEARGNPIYLHSLSYWLARRGRDESRVELSKLLKTVNHREVSATESRGFVRYAYASVAGGGETLSVYNDSTATWAKGPPPALPDKKGKGTIIASRASLPLAIVFPGAGQLAGSSKKKGVLYSLAGIAGASLVVMGVTGTKSAAKAGTIATTNEEFTAAMKNHETREKFAMAGGGAFGIAWLVGVIDAAMHRGEGGTSVSLISGPRSSRVANGAHSLGIRIPLGGNPR